MKKIFSKKTVDTLSKLFALEKQLHSLNKILNASADIGGMLDAELRIREGADREDVLEDLWGEDREGLDTEEFIQFNLEHIGWRGAPPSELSEVELRRLSKKLDRKWERASTQALEIERQMRQLTQEMWSRREYASLETLVRQGGQPARVVFNSLVDIGYICGRRGEWI